MNRSKLFLALMLVGFPYLLGAQSEQTLYTFTGFGDGGNPLSSLVMDAAGNLYGTTFVGGANGAGTVYKLTRSSDGSWGESVLYSFTGGIDGANPYYADVIFDASGNLYGTTVGGGTNSAGTVFELTPTASGWTETVLYSFGGVPDGANPYAGLLFDHAGNLFGTTYEGGPGNLGTVFELSPGSNGWTERVIYTFGGSNGVAPPGGLTLDAAGNLYGVTQGGGRYSAGVVFELSPSGGSWTGKTLYSFTGGSDGSLPFAERLARDLKGNLYGTTQGGGSLGLGAVFALMPTHTGAWKEKVLYSFDGKVAENPWAGLIFDKKGNLFGTCANGNGVMTVGAVFELSRGANGTWTETNLHLFRRNDGEFPESALFFDPTGNLYGTTLLGGADDMGVVFELRR